MNILEFYYEKVIKHDLINKFYYLNIKNIPKLEKIVLNFGCNSHNIKKLAAAILALELISLKKGKLSSSKNSNIFLKIRKGAPTGCYVILKKKKMYSFLFKLLVEIFPNLKNFKGIPNNKDYGNNNNSFSFYIEDLISLKELNNHFYIFNNLPSLNITIISNSSKKKELIYLLKSFKIPLQSSKSAIVTQLVECNLAKIKVKGSNPFYC